LIHHLEMAMKFRTFGRLGWKVSQIGFGAWAIGGEWENQSEDDSINALHRALDLGCNFIDTARVYGSGKSERLIAQVLRERRDVSVFVATKVPPVLPGDWPPSPYDTVEDRYPASHVREQVEQSLRELRTECLDIVQIHTWSMGWNRNPQPLLVLKKMQQEGKLRGVGLSTPEQDQNSVVEIIRSGLIDSIQVIYNIFEQEPQAALFPAAVEANVAVIGRVPFDESALGGKLTPTTEFGETDFRRRYLAGDRLERTIRRVEKIKEVVGQEERDVATAALKFALKPAAVSTVIPGIRNPRQAELNCAIGAGDPLSDELEKKLRTHYWRRGFWYSGK
jgi:aryl-alcohol dehydrogenase-like predicted oxidoreductase